MTRVLAPLATAALLSACTALQPPAEDIQNIYILEARAPAGSPRAKRDLVLAVSMPRARPGFDTPQMAYERRPHEIEYFTRSRWADTPARMLAPLLAQALEQSGTLRGVVQAPRTAAADLRLDLEVVRLVQDFSIRPSRVRFTLRAQLIDARASRVLATREFDEIENTPSDDPYGGVIAANRMLERLLEQLADFCAEQTPSR
jgi:cholesterol transport system auxiliary component